MKKLIGVIAGCIAVYYALDVIGTISMACAWRDLIKFGHVQAANELDDTFHKKILQAQPESIRFGKGGTFGDDGKRITNQMRSLREIVGSFVFLAKKSWHLMEIHFGGKSYENLF